MNIMKLFYLPIIFLLSLFLVSCGDTKSGAAADNAYVQKGAPVCKDGKTWNGKTCVVKKGQKSVKSKAKSTTKGEVTPPTKSEVKSNY
jgi:hypothetical protein